MCLTCEADEIFQWEFMVQWINEEEFRQRFFGRINFDVKSRGYDKVLHTVMFLSWQGVRIKFIINQTVAHKQQEIHIHEHADAFVQT